MLCAAAKCCTQRVIGCESEKAKNMEKIKLVCAKCNFTVEEYTATELAELPRKAKRYKYLLQKSSICPKCLASGRLKEVRFTEAEGDDQVSAVETNASASVPVAHEQHPEEPTPMMDAISRGAWPSHAAELKKTKYPLQMYEQALQKRTTQWGYGGYVSLPGVAAGVLVRASARPDITKGSNFVRIMDPCGNFFKADAMRGLCDIADKYAYGMLHLLSTGGDLEMLGIPTENLSPAVQEIMKLGFDVGSTGDDYRTSEECIGPAKCDLALYDTLGFRAAWYKRFLDDVQYPRFPHKFKCKFSGCPNDCVRGGQKADVFVCGVFRDLPIIDQEKVAAWVKGGGDISTVCTRCPGDSLTWDARRGLSIDGDSCLRCMYCMNKIPGVRPGGDRGVAILVGGKLRGKYGPMLAKVLVPFMKAVPPDYKEVFDLIERITEVYDEHARKKERMGDFLLRIGMVEFYRLVGVQPSTRLFEHPRTNLYYHWEPEEVRGPQAQVSTSQPSVSEG
jgi:sulfite reductase alpha subunit